MVDFREKIEWGDPFYAIFTNEIFGKGQKSTVFKHKTRKSFLKIVKLVFIRQKLVFKRLKLVFKTAKLPCPAFSLQGLGWIPHKKKACKEVVEWTEQEIEQILPQRTLFDCRVENS